MQTKFHVPNCFITILGSAIAILGVNYFLVPFGIYNGGLLGIAQIIRTVLVDLLQMNSLRQYDISGIFYYLFNIPLFFYAYKSLGKAFVGKTILSVSCQAVFMVLFQIPSRSLVEEPITGCIVGGVLVGIGIGMTLRAGGSTGDQHLIGMMASMKHSRMSVGKITILFNILVYGSCMVLFDIKVVIYSTLYLFISSVVLDRIHYQNIKVSAMIFTKNRDLKRIIMEKVYRGVTCWKGMGAYTGEDMEVLVTVISKQELSILDYIIKKNDPKAFVILTEGLETQGNYEKRL